MSLRSFALSLAFISSVALVGLLFSQHNSSQTLVILDPNVPYASFFETNARSNTTVVRLESDQNGLEQISTILRDYNNVKDLQIITHAKPGRLEIGNSALTNEVLLQEAEVITQWSNYLHPAAHISLLGCDVAAGKEGQRFVETLAALTNTTVSASTNPTGNPTAGGDWVLEVNTGKKSPQLAINNHALESYPYILNHFRYGTMNWSFVSGRTVRIKVENVWTNDHGHIPTSVDVGQTATNKFTLYFGDGDSLNATVRVTARDAPNNDVTTELVTQSGSDYISGVTHTYDTDGDYLVYWGSSARESAGAQTNGTWQSEMTVNIGNNNSSPVAAVPAIVQVLDNSIFTYQLAAIDPNGDSVQYRLGTQDEFYNNGSNSPTTPPTGLTLSSTGAIRWDVRDSELATDVNDRWQMTVMIEDLTSTGAVKSKTPLDFVFIISDKVPATFTDAPEETVNPRPGEETEFTITVQDENYEDCDDPAAPNITPLNPPSTDEDVFSTTSTSSGGTATSQVTFTPTEDMAGNSYLLQFRSTTCDGATSVQSVPVFVPGANQAPGDITLSNDNIVEHSAADTVIGTFTVSDIDPDDTHTLTLTGSTNTNIFKLGGSSGNQLQVASATLSDSGTYVVSVTATDSGSLSLTKNFTITLWLDEDEDGIADKDDSLIGNRNYPDVSGASSFSVQINEEEADGTYTETKQTNFYDGSTPMVSFMHNYSSGAIRLANVILRRSANSLVVNMGDELADGTRKTLYLDDNNFIALCVKDAPITSISEVSSGCDGANEIDFSSCIGVGGSGVTIDDITCTDEGSRFRVDNLEHSGIVGTPAPTPSADSSTDSGGGTSNGGSRRGFNPVVAWLERKEQEEVEQQIAQAHPAAGEEEGNYGSSGSGCLIRDLFNDVPDASWYAPHVCILKEEEVVSGYKDERGRETGEYGPSNYVTYAEIAKMALLAANKQPVDGVPRNRSARGDWSAPYINAMEGLGISQYSTGLDVGSPAIRGDVISIMLQVFAIAVSQHTESPFTDLILRHPNAAAILTAVDMGIMQGDTSADGTLLKTIRPDARINRAETAKIFDLLLEYVESQ